ncbi:MAG: polysaccharide export protein [Cocleimonas sp.]|nr:polysaccharide export protein [Cocleimonas sp.]
MNKKRYAQLFFICVLSSSLIACNSNKPRDRQIQQMVSYPVQPATLTPVSARVIRKPVAAIQMNSLMLNAAISPQDKLDVSVFKVPELSVKDVIVESNGVVSLPYIGSVNLLGLTLQQAEKRVETLLSKDLQNPKVSIKRTQKAIRRVTVEGAVQTPGVFPIVSSMTFLQAIAMSQGITELADVKNVIVFRDGKQYAVDLYKVRRGLSPDPALKQNDRIVVLKSNRKVTEKKVLEYLPALLAPLSLIM